MRCFSREMMKAQWSCSCSTWCRSKLLKITLLLCPCSCLFPYYCPANSSAMKSCEGGFVPVNTSGLRGSKSSCCSECEGGTYRPYLSLTLQCLPCPAGYFCPPGTLHSTSSYSISQLMWKIFLIVFLKCKYVWIQQVQRTTRVSLALLDMCVPSDHPSQHLAPLAPLVTILTPRQWMTVTHVRLVLSTICTLRGPAFPAAVRPPHQQVGSDQITLTGLNIFDRYFMTILLKRKHVHVVHVPSGSSSCSCIGKNRAFQHSDGSCLCRTGFIFYNELDFKSSTADSGLDCQPEVSSCTLSVWFWCVCNTCAACMPVCLCVCYRPTSDVPQDRYVWLHPESVCHHLSTLVTSPAHHMEEVWTWRWAC